MTIKTKNFNPETDLKLLCTCGHFMCDKRSVSQVHLDRIQEVRNVTGISMHVRSGGRCSYHPDELHRINPADHQNGNAVDIACSGWTRGNLMAAAKDAGCNAFGIAKTFVHLGWREPDKKHPDHVFMWIYPNS